jgi:hypothetical protein
MIVDWCLEKPDSLSIEAFLEPTPSVVRQSPSVSVLQPHHRYRCCVESSKAGILHPIARKQ